MALKRRDQARRVLKNAKAKKTKKADIDEAMVFLVRQGTNVDRLKRRLMRWGFTEEEANEKINAFYP